MNSMLISLCEFFVMLDYDEMNYYCNPNFRLATKARACKGVGQE